MEVYEGVNVLDVSELVAAACSVLHNICEIHRDGFCEEWFESWTYCANSTMVHIEMPAASAYSRQLTSGCKFKDVQKVISVSILLMNIEH